MSYAALIETLKPLPATMRQQIQGYVDSVQVSGDAIFREAGVPFSDEIFEQFIFIVGIRRLWTLVDTPVGLLGNSLSLLENSNAAGFSVGSRTIDRNSSYFVELLRLRKELDNTLVQLQVDQFIKISSLTELARTLWLETNGR